MQPNDITMHDMLVAREARAARQRALLDRFGVPVVCFTMIVPGPRKRGALIDRGFAAGCALIRQQLAAAGLASLAGETHHLRTGSEGYWAVKGEPERIKRAMLDIEEHTPLGRLLDIDVVDTDGCKVSRAAMGLEARACLVCGGPAHACVRSRAHDPAVVTARAQNMLNEALDALDAEHIAGGACQALLYEACTTPKPGLVDARNTGSHTDMDLFTFMASASALFPYYAACARAGISGRGEPPACTMAAIRPLGRLAEGGMLAATQGVNTHKGAVFTLGVLCAALGRLEHGQRADVDLVLAAAAAMAEGITDSDFTGLTEGTARTHGELLYVRHGITGVRGQMEAGLPAVREHGLPALRDALAQGYSANDAGCLALLHLIAHTEDTALIARGGLEGQREAREQVHALLARSPMPDKQALEALDDWFIARRLSPGGSADLLAACWLLHFVAQDAEDDGDA